MLRTPMPAAGSRLPFRRALVTAVATLGLLAVAPGAHAEEGPVTAEGPEGQSVTVTRANELDPTGAEVTVTGEGFDESIGIYVAVCVDNGPKKRPTPCLGGVDMSGTTGASGWFSSNPPSYGKDLAVPFGPGGSFELTTTVVAQDNLTDCLDEKTAPDGCVLATFADHSRIDNRSADVRIPLTFGEPGSGEPADETTQPAETTEPAEPTEPAETTAPGSAGTTAPPATPVAGADETDGSGSGPAPLILGGVGALVVIGGVAVILSRRRAAASAGGATGADDGGNDA
ncbi:hypothetical protein ATL41_1795 [Flavimobilis soli]|uniref:Neocarzinostatin family protein n=1 Tax=Flavimobilis soli TaxID=442709 RepID=A0A2A9EDP1_9MICO|nr:hypothetical protein [Flavimobilis soli]PFG37048.1 hypothetical protein ATL41_1795 [Flavimobilis soli]